MPNCVRSIVFQGVLVASGTLAAVPQADPFLGMQITGTEDKAIQSIDSSASSGAIRVAGPFKGSLSFANQQFSSRGESDIFVASYAKDGTSQWLIPIGGAGEEAGPLVASRADGTVYVLGLFSGHIVLGADGPDSVSLDSGDSDAGVFLAQISAQGKINWAKRIATRDELWADPTTRLLLYRDSQLHVLKDGGVFVQTSNYPTYWPGGKDPYNGHFVLRFDSRGELASSEEIYHSGYSSSIYSTVLKGDELLVVGPCDSQSVVFAPGQKGQQTVDCQNVEFYLAKYSAKGTFLKAKPLNVEGLSVSAVTGLPKGGYLLGGHFMFDVTFAKGEKNEATIHSEGSRYSRTHEVAFARYGESDDLIWARGIMDRQNVDLLDLVVTRDESIVATGNLGFETHFAPGESNETIVELSDAAYISTYDLNGQLKTVSWSAWNLSDEYHGDYKATGFDLSPGTRSGFSVAGPFMGMIQFGAGTPPAVELKSQPNIQDAFFLTYR